MVCLRPAAFGEAIASARVKSAKRLSTDPLFDEQMPLGDGFDVQTRLTLAHTKLLRISFFARPRGFQIDRALIASPVRWEA